MNSPIVSINTFVLSYLQNKQIFQRLAYNLSCELTLVQELFTAAITTIPPNCPALTIGSTPIAGSTMAAALTVGSTTTTAPIAGLTDFTNVKLPQLKQFCKTVGLKATGNKQTLVNKLNAYHQTSHFSVEIQQKQALTDKRPQTPPRSQLSMQTLLPPNQRPQLPLQTPPSPNQRPQSPLQTPPSPNQRPQSPLQILSSPNQQQFDPSQQHQPPLQILLSPNQQQFDPSQQHQPPLQILSSPNQQQFDPSQQPQSPRKTTTATTHLDVVLEQDNYGVYIHPPTGLVFDPQENAIVAYKHDGENFPLSIETIELCQQFGLRYSLPQKF